MKINIGNVEPFTSDRNLKIKKCAKTGLVIVIAAVGVLASAAMLNGCTPTNDTGIALEQKDPLEISVNQVNDLNIIINNSNCSDNFINDIAEELKKDGISFTLTSKEKNINVNGAVVITLDQQYISGPGMVVLAPYENNRNGNSDALALAMQAGFNEKGFFADEIQCGKMGYQQLEDGTVVEQIPSETEAAISPTYDTSFVTLCFGTSNNNAELVGKSIKLALARYTNYVTNENAGIDLVYRSEIGDTAEDVASKTGVDVADITTDGVLLDDTTVINSGVKKLDSFDRRSPVSLGGIESSNWYHK